MPRLEHRLIKDFRVKRYQLETKLGDTVVSCYLLVREFTEIIDELKHANACIRIDCHHGRPLVTYRPRFFRPWCSNVSRANLTAIVVPFCPFTDILEDNNIIDVPMALN